MAGEHEELESLGGMNVHPAGTAQPSRYEGKIRATCGEKSHKWETDIRNTRKSGGANADPDFETPALIPGRIRETQTPLHGI